MKKEKIGTKQRELIKRYAQKEGIQKAMQVFNVTRGVVKYALSRREESGSWGGKR